MLSSIFESTVWEELTGAESVSTMTVLKNATAQGIELLVLNEENYEEMSEKLEADSAALADIEEAVKAGKQVTVPAKEVTMDDWTGTGYIIMDPASGAGVYRISGGLNGGIITGLVTTEAILGTMLMLIDIGIMVSEMVCQVALLATGTVALSAGVLLILVVELAFLIAAICELVRLINLYVKFLNGDLEAGEQIVTETMIVAALNVVFRSIDWIVKKCAGVLRTNWKKSKLYKKTKELFGDSADDIDPGDGDGPEEPDVDGPEEPDVNGPGGSGGSGGSGSTGASGGDGNAAGSGGGGSGSGGDLEGGSAFVSQTKIEHVLTNHTFARMMKTVDALMEKGLTESAENLLNKKSFFNPEWSEEKVEEAVNYVYNEAVSKGITNENYTSISFGEKITV